MRKISIIDNGLEISKQIAEQLIEKFKELDFEILTSTVNDAELIVCIGGDGSFLSTLAKFNFPTIPFAGINTGHLGFFQELDEEDIDFFIERYLVGKYARQKYRTVEGVVKCNGKEENVRGLNEIVIKSNNYRLAHLDIYIGDNFIEKFSGDGIVVSTPAGSTAYNYALGGSLVDPRLNLLQLTPIAATSNAAYRSFTSGIILPPDLNLEIRTQEESENEISIAVDGNDTGFENVSKISIGLSEGEVELLRFKDYEFWNTVKQKLLTE